MARLTVLLGGGGVGKTTLAAGFGLALAHAGRRVALLGVDPARRLQSALGLADLPELGVAIAHSGSGELHAALLRPEDSLRRWVAESCPDEATRARLFANPFFVALANRLAGATDAIGAARVAEWAEREPDLDDLVVDTAPGVAALELLARPDKLVAFFDGRLIRWLRYFAAGAPHHHHRMLDGLAQLAGGAALREFGEFITLVDDAVARLVARLERARRWLREPATSLVVVCGPSRDGAHVALELGEALRAMHLPPRLAVVNRALPPTLLDELPPPGAADDARTAALVAYMRGYAQRQVEARQLLDGGFAHVRALPEAALHGGDRLEALARLGAGLL